MDTDTAKNIFSRDRYAALTGIEKYKFSIQALLRNTSYFAQRSKA
jgi:hypothetical protein